MVAFPQLCLICLVKGVDIVALTSGQFFSLILESVAFERLRKKSSDKLDSYSLKNSKSNCQPPLDFLSNFKINFVQRKFKKDLLLRMI